MQQLFFCSFFSTITYQINLNKETKKVREKLYGEYI